MKVSIAALGKFHSFDLAEQMRQRGHLHRLYTGYPRAKVPMPLRPYAKTCPWLTVPLMLAGRYGWEGVHNRMNVAATLLFDKWLTRVLEPCDVFHCWASYGMFATIRAKYRWGAKVICDRGSTHILHQQRVLTKEFTTWHQPAPRFSSTLVQRELQQYRDADVMTVPSRAAAQTFKDAGLLPSVVPYGVDLERFKSVPKEDKKFRVLYVGALSLRKGLPYLFDAYQMASKKDWSLWLVGNILKESHPWVSRLPNEVDWQNYNLRPKDHAWGAIPQHRLPWFISQASVVVLPSIEEGLALVLGQALACGVPVIATRESGVEELITDGVEGFVCKARDPQDIATYLTRLYDYPDELAWMQRQIEKKRGEWHWNKYGERMVKVYDA